MYSWFGRFGYPQWERHTHLYRAGDNIELTYFARKLDEPHAFHWASNSTIMEFEFGEVDKWTNSGVFDSFRVSKVFANSFTTCSDQESFVNIMNAIMTYPTPGRWSVHFTPNDRCSPRKRDLNMLVPQGGNFIWYFEKKEQALITKMSARINPAY